VILGFRAGVHGVYASPGIFFYFYFFKFFFGVGGYDWSGVLIVVISAE
jgi:hypothetical protein